MIVLVSEPWYDEHMHVPFQVFPSDVMQPPSTFGVVL
jgi:hypothetical protein